MKAAEVVQKNVTDQEAACLLRLAREGVHPLDIDRLMRKELYCVQFERLSMNQKSKAYGDYRARKDYPSMPYSLFVSIAGVVMWDLETGNPWEAK